MMYKRRLFKLSVFEQDLSVPDINVLPNTLTGEAVHFLTLIPAKIYREHVGKFGERMRTEL